ncbi:MAG: 1-acyl-sn-glycerol-3-phosphate acyltransferase [Halioglobus sp.]
MTDPFADIRPYRDEEVPAVLTRLLHDKEFLTSLARLRLGAIARVCPPLWRKVAHYYLNRELRGVQDVHGMQMVVKGYMAKMIAQTTSGFSVSGLDQLDPNRSYLFMSNHRDIAMDPALTTYALHLQDHETTRIAIGDNLLTTPWVSDVMRLNKSFIVKRDLSGPRELLAAAKLLSSYIRHSIQEEHVPIWIAQREGRAKDGVDRTEPAVIKMLSLCRDKSVTSFAEHIQGLNIVPIAISYELDPCDALKAKEMDALATSGSYEKGEQEDVASIGYGIAGSKGRVHVSFGTPLAGGFETAEAVAAEVDRQIINGYCLHPTNLFAYRMLNGEDAEIPPDLYLEGGDTDRHTFAARINAMPAGHRSHALAIYANAVNSKLALARD